MRSSNKTRQLIWHRVAEAKGRAAFNFPNLRVLGKFAAGNISAEVQREVYAAINPLRLSFRSAQSRH